MSELKIFENEEFGQVRTVTIDGEPWFVGKDVALALQYKEPQKAVRTHVDEEDRGVSEMDTPGGKQVLAIINESGLYSLIFGSKLESAKRFKHWVTSEVLPALHKTGHYEMPGCGANVNGFLGRNGVRAGDVINFMFGDESYHPKATSVSEVVNLLQYLTSSMEVRGCSQEDIAQMAIDICAQFNIQMPRVFFPYAAQEGKLKKKKEKKH